VKKKAKVKIAASSILLISQNLKLALHFKWCWTSCLFLLLSLT